jgi:hypothetical protein
MYYRKHEEIPGIPEEIKHECIKIGRDKIDQNIPMPYRFGRYEYEDSTSISYIEKGTEEKYFNKGNGGSVGFYPLPEELASFLINFYKDTDHPIRNNAVYYLQVVTGGKSVAPHIDASSARKDGFLYLLQAGGTDVRTVWYEVKEEYRDQKLIEYTGIPYDKLDIIESHCLEEDTWHWLNFSKIHSVENQQSLRLSIFGRS